MIRVKNGKDFKRAMTAIALKVEKRMGKQINRKLALDAFKRITDRTPSDKGYLKHNWDVEIDKPAPDEIEPPPEKGKKYPEPKRPDTRKVEHNSIITIFNNTEYATYIENGVEGRMEAQPMVAPTEIEVYAQAEELCKAFSIEKIDD